MIFIETFTGFEVSRGTDKAIGIEKVWTEGEGEGLGRGIEDKKLEGAGRGAIKAEGEEFDRFFCSKEARKLEKFEVELFGIVWVEKKVEGSENLEEFEAGKILQGAGGVGFRTGWKED